MRVILAALLIAAVPAAAQRPWEERVDIALPVPVELPSIPPSNPFALAVDTVATAVRTPLAEEFAGTFPVTAAGYVDAEGECRRVVVTVAPLPGLAAVVTTEVGKTRFNPGLLMGTSVPTWVTMAIDLAGRIEEGSVTRIQSVAPDPAAPPTLEPRAFAGPDARDLQLPATSVENLEKLPSPKRFRIRADGLDFRQNVRLLAEIGERGNCARVIFLSCPEGLRGWLVASLAEWTFQPAARAGQAVSAWVIVEAELLVQTSTLRADSVRIVRQDPFVASDR